MSLSKLCSILHRRGCGFQPQHLLKTLRLEAAVITIAFVITLCFTAFTTANADEPTPPNIILIMADDIGVEGIGC